MSELSDTPTVSPAPTIEPVSVAPTIEPVSVAPTIEPVSVAPTDVSAPTVDPLDPAATTVTPTVTPAVSPAPTIEPVSVAPTVEPVAPTDVSAPTVDPTVSPVSEPGSVVADVLNKIVTNVAAAVASVTDVAAVAGSDASASDQIVVALVDEIVEDNDRKMVELGLQTFNAINAADHVCETIVEAIRATIDPSESVKMYCNPAVGLLSDFAPHYKMLISANGDDSVESIEGIISRTFAELITRPMFDGLDARITPAASSMGNHFTQISLVLWIGKVFHVPIFTAYVVRNALNADGLDAAIAVKFAPFQHNAKLIATYNQLDVFLELLLHSEESDIYAPVNVLIARGIHASIVSNFTKSPPNAAIAAGCQPFFDMIQIHQIPKLRSVVAKMALIAVMQDPSVKTAQGEHFSDIFPSGQYGKYFGEVAHQATTDTANQGPIMMDDRVPLTRTDIIIAAMTAMNKAMSASGAHMVISGGAAVSFYIQAFLKRLETEQDSFQSFQAVGIDMAQLTKDCGNIRMNDIDCVVFGDVSRQFLSVFSLYMMIMYDNFFARPKRYGVAEVKDAPPISFALSATATDRIDLHVYGNRDDDANTMLISKRLRKEPSVQLVTQKIMFFSQIMHPLCEHHPHQQQQSHGCKEDKYYLEPVDLVKKTIEHFVKLYMRSLYPKSDAKYATEDPATREKIGAMLKEEYYRDNLVSLKIIMLDIICIFCDEGASLFCRIFMARKNPKDFARLRVFIDIYLLQLMRSGGDSFAQENAEFIADVRQLRDLMSRLNADYYLEQGSIAAVNADVAEQLNARRDEFLGLLREVGRAIVELAPPDEPVPIQFQEATGASTIQFFKESPQIKYKFDMNQHMAQLFGCHAQPQPQPDPGSYDEWLNSVFETILVAPKVESVFREKLATILSMDPESNYEIKFKDMATRSPYMLELLNALKGIKMDEAKLKQMNKFKALRSNLLGPLREFIASQGGVAPSATYVIKLYDKSTIHDYLMALVMYALLNKELQGNAAESGLMKIISDSANYDDAVREEIGRILLEWNQHAPPRLGGGGSTRKRKRVCRLKNAKTRSKTRTGKRRNTRRKIKANKLRFNRTHR